MRKKRIVFYKYFLELSDLKNMQMTPSKVFPLSMYYSRNIDRNCNEENYLSPSESVQLNCTEKMAIVNMTNAFSVNFLIL